MTQPKSQGTAPKPAETDDYSASQAPETQEEAQEQTAYSDTRLIPGGAIGSPAEIGFTAMSEDEVPSRAHKPPELDVRDSPDDER